jgi:hypothetical protein
LDHLARSPIQPRAAELLARDQAALKSLVQRLAYKRRLYRFILNQIENRSQWPRVVVAGASLEIAFG